MTASSSRLTEFITAAHLSRSLMLLLALTLLAALATACAAAPTATPSPEPTATAAPVQLSVAGRWSAPPETTIHAIAAAHIGSVPHLAVAIESADSSRVALVDVSNTAAPSLAGTLETPFDSRDMVAVGIDLSDGTAYVSLVGSESGLWVVDVSDPTQPRHLSHLPLGLGFLRGLHAEGGSIVLVGHFRNLGESTALPPLGRPGIFTVDASDPKQPAIVASLPGSIHGHDAAVTVLSGIAYVVGLDRLYVMDVSDKAAIAEMGELAREEDAPITYTRTVSGVTAAGYVRAESAPRDVAVQGSYAYLASGSGGLRVIDVSTPEAPFEVGTIGAPSLQSVAVSGDWVFAYDYAVPPPPSGPTQLLAIDVSRPEVPMVLSVLDLKEPQPFLDITTLGGRVYAIDGFREVVAVVLSGG